MREALQEARDYRDDTNEGGPGSGPQKGGKKQSSADIKKAYGILNDPRYKQGNYSGAAKAIDKLSPGLSNHPDVKNAMKRANEELEEENRFSRQLKGRQREVYDLALKDIRKNKVYGEKDQDAVVDKVAGTSLMGKSLSDVKQAIQHESLDLSATGDTTTSNASQELDEIVEEESTDEMFSTRSLGLKGASKRSRDKAREKDKDSEKTKKKEELDEAAFSQAQIDTLKKAYGSFSSTGVSTNNMNKLRDTMKRYSKDHLSQLAKLDIPMVSKTAKELL